MFLNFIQDNIKIFDFYKIFIQKTINLFENLRDIKFIY